MRRELRRLQTEIGLTIVYVTHDQIEALSLADRIAVMNAGKIRQIERTSVICERPEHIFVASFLGSPPMNLVRGHIVRSGVTVAFRRDELLVDLTPGMCPPQGSDDQPVVLGVRPESVKLTAANGSPISGKVALVEPRGPEAVVTVEVGAVVLKVVAPSAGRPQEGANVGLVIDPPTLVFFSGETGRRLAS
jgi:multiple sugar transport system ATP-binding protein